MATVRPGGPGPATAARRRRRPQPGGAVTDGAGCGPGRSSPVAWDSGRRRPGYDAAGPRLGPGARRRGLGRLGWTQSDYLLQSAWTAGHVVSLFVCSFQCIRPFALFLIDLPGD
jgi:hypothetical protein